MPWKKATNMSQRTDFIAQAKLAGANLSALCRAFGISRKTGYKWLKRERASGAEALADQSRRPRNSPKQTDSAIETRGLEVRQEHQAWGGRKIPKVLPDSGCEKCPPARTSTTHLHLH